MTIKIPCPRCKPRCGDCGGYAIITSDVKEKGKVKRSAC